VTRRVRAAAALAVAALAAALLLPESRLGWWLTEDATEHLAIAHALVHGAGFVDPIQWAFTLPTGVPLPAHAVRPPLLPLLLALPLGLGATLSQVMWLHALYASLVAGAVVWVGGRFLGLPAAVGAALLVATSRGWAGAGLHPWTEVTGAACLLGVLASARGVLHGPRGAALCAAWTILAWLARPNLGALVLAVAVAALLEAGPRRALRSPGLWSYLLGFAAVFAALQLGARAATGFGLYAGYSGEMLAYEDVWSYGRRPAGTLAWAQAHADAILGIWARRAFELARDLCVDPLHHRSGWLLAPAVLWALAVPRRGALERRLCAFAALGFSLVVVLNYAPYEARYATLPFFAGVLCLGAALDDAARALAPRVGGRARLAGALPLLAALALIALGSGGTTLERPFDALARRRAGERVGPAPGPIAPLCAAMDPDAAVAAVLPWPLHLWCGNAALILPIDLGAADVRARFLADKRPRYVVASREPSYAWLARDPAFRALAESGRFVLYEAAGPPPAPPWRAPPPLACAGQAADCLTKRAAGAPAGSVLER
jgi:hypothetical protein